MHQGMVDTPQHINLPCAQFDADAALSPELSSVAGGEHVCQDRLQVEEGVVGAGVPQLHPQGKTLLHGFHNVVAAQCIGPSKRRHIACIAACCSGYKSKPCMLLMIQLAVMHGFCDGCKQICAGGVVASMRAVG